MKIYFSGSIRGAKINREIYRIIIDHLKKYGRVLTEHVAEVDEYDESEMSDEKIFEQDVEWLRSADALVAEVTAPSLGVGYEIGKAEEYRIPVLCLYNKKVCRKLSAMIEGNPYLVVKKYDILEEATKIIDKYFSKLG